MIRDPKELGKKLGLDFNNPELFAQALTHRSMGAKNNERLEFLGDSILGFVIAEALYEKFPSACEGVLSRLRASLVNRDSLTKLARQHKLGDYLILGSGELKSGGFSRASILSDALEAIMGATFRDQGYARCRDWILQLFAERLAEVRLDNWEKDPKTRLQEYLQGRQMDIPSYTLLSQRGMPHEQIFEVECATDLFDKKFIGTSVSRKKAEQQAAELALAEINKES